MAEKSRTESVVSTLKDGVAVLRDGLLLVVLVLLLVAPKLVSSRLEQAGFTSGSVAGFEWKARLNEATQQTKLAGETVEKAATNYDALIESLNELEKRTSDPSVKESVQSIREEAKATSADLSGAGRAVARSLGAQQQIAESVAPSLVSEGGWIFLGRVTEDKGSWAKGESPKVRSQTPELKPGAQVTVVEDVYLRAEGPSSSHASAPIVGVARVGQDVEILELDYSHARAGGWFAWARVRRR